MTRKLTISGAILVMVGLLATFGSADDVSSSAPAPAETVAETPAPAPAPAEAEGDKPSAQDILAKIRARKSD